MTNLFKRDTSVDSKGGFSAGRTGAVAAIAALLVKLTDQTFGLNLLPDQVDAATNLVIALLMAASLFGIRARQDRS